LADILILGALLMLTVALYGVLRMPDIYTRLHASSKTAVFGVAPLLVALMLSGEASFISRALLIGVFILCTTPVSAHAIARAAFETDPPKHIERWVVDDAAGGPGGHGGPPLRG
jgi:multicomponent Na+:H+ antiporter subunit G